MNRLSGDAGAEAGVVQELADRPGVPKLTIRRDSVTGKGWVNLNNTTEVGKNLASSTSVTSNMSRADNAVKVVSGMVNAIRATFKQVENVTAGQSSIEKTMVDPDRVKITENTNPRRVSSASRGRGIEKSKGQ